jgi:thiamine-monophosphate kinase
VLKGIGDDAAVIKLRNNDCLVWTTDLLAEGVHFDLAYTPLRHLGYKAIAVNVSDIFAMNARPTAALCSVAVSNRFAAEALQELYAGMAAACDEYGIDLVGGDTSSSPTGMFLNITVIGFGHEDELVYRTGARPGDVLCVTGDLGAAFAGLQILQREKQVYLENPELQPDLTEHAYVVERQLKPEARADMFDVWAQRGVRPTSLIDVSDGLASECFHLAQQSRVLVHLEQDKLPLDPRTHAVAKAFGQQFTHYALYGGEDYELLFTVRPEDHERLADHPNITAIGSILALPEGQPPKVAITLADGSIQEVNPLGYNHFRG